MTHLHGYDNELLAARMPQTEDCRRVADVFAQLGDGTRLKILWLLCHSEQCVTNIAALTGMSGPAVAQLFPVPTVRDGIFSALLFTEAVSPSLSAL